MEHRLLDAGKVVSPHGILGEVKVLPWADAPEFLLQFATVYIGAQAYAVERSRVHGNCVLLKLASVDSIEQAGPLRNQVVRIDRSGIALPQGQVFIADLIGCRCLDEDGTEFGKIKDVLTMPSSDVYVIEGAHSYMIPAVKEFVREINTAQGYVKLHLIEGFQTDEN